MEVLLTELALNGSIHDPVPATGPVPDPGDSHLWALLQSAPTTVLVTGDDALLRNAPAPGRVLSPRRFLSLSRASG